MAVIGKRLKEARLRKRYSQIEAAKLLGISNGTLSGYERNYRDPDTDILKKMAELYEVSIDYLLGKTDDPNPVKEKLPPLNAKDERDIAKDLEEILNSLEPGRGYAHFEGRSIDDMDEEDRELLKASLETSLRIAKQIAKKKFTPRKYRNQN